MSFNGKEPVFATNEPFVNGTHMVDVVTRNDFPIVTNGGKCAVHFDEPPGSGTVVGGFNDGCVFDNHNELINNTSKKSTR